MAAIIFLFEYWAKEEFETKMKRRAESRIDQFQIKSFQKRPGEKRENEKYVYIYQIRNKLFENYWRKAKNLDKTHLITEKNVYVLESVP